jgi:hypothetical protein
MTGYFPSPDFKLLLGVKYRPFYKSILDALSDEGVDVGSTLPLSYMIYARYMFDENWDFMPGGEIYDLSVDGERKQEVSTTDHYIYFDLKYR